MRFNLSLLQYEVQFEFATCEMRRFQDTLNGPTVTTFVIASEIWVRLPSGRFFLCKVRAVDSASDLAVLELPPGMVGLETHIFKLFPRDVLLGQLCFFIGHPGFENCIKSGRFSAYRKVTEICDGDESGRTLFLDENLALEVENRRLLELETGAPLGVSGAAAVDEFGAMVGVVVEGTKDMAQGAGGLVGFVVPVKYCLELLKWSQKKNNTGSVFMYGDEADDYEK